MGETGCLIWSLNSRFICQVPRGTPQMLGDVSEGLWGDFYREELGTVSTFEGKLHVHSYARPKFYPQASDSQWLGSTNSGSPKCEFLKHSGNIRPPYWCRRVACHNKQIGCHCSSTTTPEWTAVAFLPVAHQLLWQVYAKSGHNPPSSQLPIAEELQGWPTQVAENLQPFKSLQQELTLEHFPSTYTCCLCDFMWWMLPYSLLFHIEGKPG